MIEAIIQRLTDRVDGLSEHRVQGAVEWASVVQSAVLPQADFFAFAIPAGMTGQPPSSMTGIFVQPFEHRIDVVLGFRTHSPTAERALVEVQSKIDAVMVAICGFAPDTARGAFRLVSGKQSGFAKGAFFYQLQFAINDELRHTT